MKCISKIFFNIFKNYQSIKLLNNDHWTRIYLTPELCKKKGYLRTIMFLVLLSFVCFFIKFKKVKYGKQRDENRTEIYSKIY